MREKQEMMICNMCGRSLLVENGIPKEDYIQVSKPWGYFSEKDGKIYNFLLCEKCSDNLVKSFLVPVDIKDATELL